MHICSKGDDGVIALQILDTALQRCLSPLLVSLSTRDYRERISIAHRAPS